MSWVTGAPGSSPNCFLGCAHGGYLEEHVCQVPAGMSTPKVVPPPHMANTNKRQKGWRSSNRSSLHQGIKIKKERKKNEGKHFTRSREQVPALLRNTNSLAADYVLGQPPLRQQRRAQQTCRKTCCSSPFRTGQSGANAAPLK